MEKAATHLPTSFTLADKAKDYFMLTKFTLSFTVVFTCVICYLLAPNVTFDLLSILVLFFAGLCITGAANAMNQTMEKNTDAMMRRTAKRPVASGRMSTTESWTFAITASAVGILTMGFFFNWESAGVSAFSLFLYSFIYTPMKKRSPLAVLMGAIPGALPNLIGWVAATSYINPFATVQGIDANGHVFQFLNIGGYVLFGIQFLWQFPHFWAIAWLAHKDYSRAGFKLLPDGSAPNKYSAIQAFIYSLVMIPVGMLPYYYNISGILSFWIVLVCGLWLAYTCLRLVIEVTPKAARRMMFSAYFYLVIVFLALLFDKV